MEVLTHYKTINISSENHQFTTFGRCSQIVEFNLCLLHLNMKVFVVLSVLLIGAMSARLDNTYIPPASAHSAGGHNLDTPKLALASNVQHSYSAPAGGRTQTQYQQQSYQQPGLNQGTFTSVSRGNGFQSVSVGSHSSQSSGGYQAPQQNYQQQQSSYQAPQQNYQQQSSYQAPQQNYQAQGSYQQSGYNAASTTPIPILKCKKRFSI
jgi:hypothetical protein